MTHEDDASPPPPVGDTSDKHKEAEASMPPNEIGAAAKVPLNAESAGEDPAKVTFVSGKDAKVDMGDDDTNGVPAQKKADDPYPALTKAELMEFANDPFWVRLRWLLFALFWVAWLGMLVAAVVIIVLAPKCYSPEPKEWWQKGPVYEVYVKSFQDSDGNGIGDLKGVESRVGYLSSLGVGAVWLSPIYPSPGVDNGYDVSDFKGVDPDLGSMQDFKDLKAALDAAGIKLIMDFVPNHSSDEHDWFKRSARGEEEYKDYYVWADGKNGGRDPPSNWLSVFGGSAWERNGERNQYYLHQFYKEQPDLNVRNTKVVAELEGILKFWLDLGVDGFRMDAVAHLFEDAERRDEDVRSGASYNDVDHKYTYNLPECLDLLRRFRTVLDAKTAEDEYSPRIMLTEGPHKTADLVPYYGTNFGHHAGDIAHLPLNFALIDAFATPADVTADKLNSAITDYLSALPRRDNGTWPNFALGSHDVARAADRFGHQLVDAANMMYMLLPGTPVTYYGEEIGMKNGPGSLEERIRPRTPMQWNGREQAGFTSSKEPWVAVNADSSTVNVEDQDSAAASHLNTYRFMAHLRHKQAVLFGSFDTHVDGPVFAFNRVRKGNPGYLFAVNLGDAETKANVTALPGLPDKGAVEARSFQSKSEDPGAEEPSDADPEALSKSVAFEAIPLKPKEAVIINFVPNL